MTEFFPGDRVLAPAFGEGTVALADGFVPYQTLTVDFDLSGRHVISPSQVKLELVERGEAGQGADAEDSQRATEIRKSRVEAGGGSVDGRNRPESRTPRAAASDPPGSVAAELRRVIREELGVADVEIGERWAGGEVVIRPGRPGLREKTIPVEAFFHKIVMVRDRLRVLEQKLNSSPKLSDAEKVELQGYITKVYGSLTTFNVLFADRDDWFVGEKGSEE